MQPHDQFCSENVKISFIRDYLVAALLSLAAGIVTRNLLVTIGMGLAAFFVHRYFV